MLQITKFSLSKIGMVNIFAILQLTVIRTYFVIFLEQDLLTEVLIVASLLTLQNLFQIFLRIPLANLSQIIGRKPLILGGSISFTLALLFLGIANHWAYALISVIFVAIGMSAYWPAVFAYLGDISTNKSNVGEMNGRVFQFGDLGQLLGAGIASLLLSPESKIGAITLSEFYRIVFILGAVGNMLSYLVIRESLADENRILGEKKVKNFLKSMTQVFADFKNTSALPGLFPIYIMQFAIAFLEFGFGIFYPSLLKFFGYLESDIADLLMIATLLLILVKPRLGKVSDIFGYKLPVTLGFLVVSISIFLMAGFNIFIIHLIGVTIIIGLNTIFYAAMNSYTANTAPIMKGGIAMGTLGVYTSLGRALSTLIIGILASNYDIIIAFKIFAGILLIISGIFFLEFKNNT